MGAMMGLIGGVVPGALGLMGARFGTFLRGEPKS